MRAAPSGGRPLYRTALRRTLARQVAQRQLAAGRSAPPPGPAAPDDHRRAVRAAAVVTAVAVAARTALGAQPLKPDEAGYLLVARTAHPGGPFLYGDLWVDRPPLLILAYRVADGLGGRVGLRVLAVLAVVVLVMAAAWAGWTVAGARGSRWASVVAAGFACTPLFTAPEVDGEVLAVPLVMVAVAAGLRAQLGPASRARWRAPALVLVAGVVGACAVLVKQNFTDALVLLGVLLVLRAVRRQVRWRTAVGQLACLVVGAALPVAGAVAWAASWHGSVRAGARALWGPLVAFRSSSLDVITDQSLTAPLARAGELFWVSLLSGLFVLLVGYVLRSLRAVRRVEPLPTAVVVMAVSGQPAIALGGSFWPHYLLQLIPVAVLAVAELAARGGLDRLLAGAMTAVVGVSALVAVPAAVPATLSSGCQTGSGAATTGRWLARAAHPGDTVAMVYSGVTVVEESGLTPAYPYQWSLPLRVLDPHVRLLRERLSGPGAATWVIVTLPLDSWHLDDSGRLSVVLVSNYQQVASVCGRAVLLREGVTRTLPAAPHR